MLTTKSIISHKKKKKRHIDCKHVFYLAMVITLPITLMYLLALTIWFRDFMRGLIQ